MNREGKRSVLMYERTKETKRSLVSTNGLYQSIREDKQVAKKGVFASAIGKLKKENDTTATSIFRTQAHSASA